MVEENSYANCTVQQLLAIAEAHEKLCLAIEDFFNGGLSEKTYQRLLFAISNSKNTLNI